MSFGSAWNRREATPETTAAAWEVPVPLKYALPTRAPGFVTSTELPAARSETMVTPGATRSGFENPSWVGPRDEKSETVSSLNDWVFLRSAAPTVTTYGSSAGLVIVFDEDPRFPAETLTKIPERHACSTA